MECGKLVDNLNRFIPEEHPKLTIPDMKFHRSIGDYAGKPYGVTGELLSTEEYEKHLAEVLPNPEDEKILNDIFKEKDWVLQQLN